MAQQDPGLAAASSVAEPGAEAGPSSACSASPAASEPALSAAEEEKELLQDYLDQDYKWGFSTDIEAERIPRGLSEDTVRLISAKKGEPDWMLDFRLKAYRKWLTMEEPDWSDNTYPPIDYQNIVYYSEPKVKEKKQSLDEVDPDLLATFDKLGIPIQEQKMLANVAVDAVFDSVSIATTFREDLMKHGVIFCSISEAVQICMRSSLISLTPSVSQ